MIRPILYPDLVALARVIMHTPLSADHIADICDKAHAKAWSLEDATHDLPKVDGFSLNSNRSLSALIQVVTFVLVWRRKTGLP